MAITNNNLKLIDRPTWEQLTSALANSAAGASMVDDGYRFIYYMISATSFWGYDTWTDTWMQLASPPGGTLAAGSCLRYVTEMGSQTNGEIFGSVYAFIASGTAVVFYRYDIGTNAWTAALSVVNVSATFAVDGRLFIPEPCLNACEGGYHDALSLNVITTSAQALAGATSISVNALPLALPAGAVLNFGTYAAPVRAVLTAAASASATSITVSALIATVNSASTAYWYANMFLFGNNSTTWYRYNIAGNAWTTTSANSGTPALATVTAALGAGHIICWLPGSGEANALNRIIVFRGTATGTAYEYNLTANTWATLTYYPFSETFTTGTSSGIRMVNGKNKKLVIQKDATGRVYEFDRLRLRLEPICTQNLITSGTALVGDRQVVLKDPTNTIEYIYVIPSTSAYFLRSAFII